MPHDASKLGIKSNYRGGELFFVRYNTEMIRAYSSSFLMPLLSALLLSLSLPWVGFSYLVWVALIPLFLFIFDERTTKMTLIAYSCAALFIYNLAAVFPLFFVSGAWWAGTHELNRLLHENMQYSIGVITTALWRTIIFIPFILFARRSHKSQYGLLLTPLVWVVLELVCANYGLWGYSIGVLGYSGGAMPAIKYLAILGGVYALSLLFVSVNIVIAELLRHDGGIRAFIRSTPASTLLIVAAVFAVLSGYCLWHTKSSETQTLKVAVIGTTLSTDESISEAGYRSYRTKLERALETDPELVLFPENAFPYFEINESDGTLVGNTLINFPERDALYADLLSLSRAHSTTTLAVGLHTRRNKKHYNSIAYIKNGMPVGYYEKRVLVPFTEYAPAGLPIPLAVRLSPGDSRQQQDISGITVSGLICSEIAVTNINLNGARLLLAPSNDSIFTGAAAARMHDAAARIKALEYHVYLLRADKGGLSSIIDPEGNTLASTADGVITMDLNIHR